LLDNEIRTDLQVSPYKTTAAAISALKRVSVIPTIKHLGPYLLRKTCASWLAQAGVEAYHLTKIMGHSSLETTMKYYIRLDHQDLAESLSKL